MPRKKIEPVGPTPEQAKAEAKARAAKPKTGEGTHVATRRGYAGGELIEEGGAIPAGIAISEVWMAEA
jgi:hypothetical protein